MLYTQIGLVVDAIGALLVAFSIGEPPVGLVSVDEKGKSFNVAAILHPLQFRVGAVLIIIGFICQFIGTFQSA